MVLWDVGVEDKVKDEVAELLYHVMGVVLVNGVKQLVGLVNDIFV